MSTEKKHSVCPVERAGALEFAWRKWLQNPNKILRPHIREGMTVLDLGCGPGFFTLEMARLAGNSGKVIAADLQEGMLNKLRAKIQHTLLATRVRFHQCLANKIGLSEKFDFILVFYMLHEVPDPANFLAELRSLLKPGGRVLLVEPGFHVTRGEFQEAIGRMSQAGFDVVESPRIRFSRAVVLRQADGR